MASIIMGRASRTEGTQEEASTEGIDVRPVHLENTCVEFYDCAGQVDYGGMHQVFLTRRALFLLVWDITRCSDLSISEFDKVGNSSESKMYPWVMYRSIAYVCRFKCECLFI